jgi:hypothetical protein
VTLLTDAQQSVLTRFLANWTGTTAARVVFQNEGHESVDLDEAAWVRLSVQEVTGGQQTLGPIGDRKYRRRARVDVQVFTPADRGMQPGLALAQQVRSIFEGKTFDGLYFFDCVVADGGKDEKWHQVIATTRFDFWETK